MNGKADYRRWMKRASFPQNIIAIGCQYSMVRIYATWLSLAGSQAADPDIQGRGDSCCWLLGEGALQVRHMFRANIGRQQSLISGGAEQVIYLHALRHSFLLLESRAAAAGCMQSVAPSDRCSVPLKQAAGSHGRWEGRRAGQALDKGNGRVSSSCALAGAQ